MNSTKPKLAIIKEGCSPQYSLLIKKDVRGVRTHLKSGRRYFKSFLLKSFNGRWLIDISLKNNFKKIKDIIKQN